MKKWILLSSLFLLGACSCYREIPITLPDGSTLPVRVADTYKKQERAWLGQKEPFDKGVLFVFIREEEQAYWRKNTLLDLDVIFLDSNLKATAIKTHLPHREKYTINNEIPVAFAQAKYLLELPAGMVEKHAISVGDSFHFTLSK